MLWKGLILTVEVSCTICKDVNKRNKNLENSSMKRMTKSGCWEKVNHKIPIKNVAPGIKITRHAKFLKSCSNRPAYLWTCVSLCARLYLLALFTLKNMNNFPWKVSSPGFTCRVCYHYQCTLLKWLTKTNIFPHLFSKLQSSLKALWGEVIGAAKLTVHLLWVYFLNTSLC